ncbi:hypothetical protein LPJ56_003465 [Coemansia sp. RSA 2599]|nr:hypothetical protein LPJ75_003231 [Coemansia sp. RSA 2598]KAJ1820299.1 hypothetical protein LPJ56_003465 [Coemansia sp. RSA 2599]
MRASIFTTATGLLVFLASAVQAEDDGKHTGIKGGGGDGTSGNGKWGDKPPLTPELFPDRSGLEIKAEIVGDGDSSKPYKPLLKHTANAQFPVAKRYQTVLSHTFSKYSPAVYYASATRDEYPGAWGHGFYLVYPYPGWAYGEGRQLGPTFYCNATYTDFSKYKGHLRNMTVVDGSNVPLLGDYDIFGNGRSVSFKDYNNGTVEIKPCGRFSSSEFGVSNDDCRPVVLDLVYGSVVDGNAAAKVQNEFTLFKLKLGQKEAVLRIVTISSTESRLSEGGVTFLIFFGGMLSIPVFIAIMAGAICLGSIVKGYIVSMVSYISPYVQSLFSDTLKPWYISAKKRVSGNGAYERLDEATDAYMMS